MIKIELTELIARHTPNEGFTETPIPGLELFRQNTPTTESMPVIYDPAICVIAQGAKCLRVGERRIRYDPWNFVVNALKLPMTAEIPEASDEEPFLGFLIRFDTVQVGKLLAEIGDVDVSTDPPARTIDATPITEPLARALTRLLGCLDDPVDRRVLSDALIRQILYEVLRGPCGFVLREQAQQGGATYRVGRAVAFLEENFREPVDVDSIARHAGMSSSALHQHFKQVTALSPMQFVQRLRLHQARALLLGGESASAAGFEVGYNSPSQFSREFRRLFGVPPSRVREPSNTANMPGPLLDNTRSTTTAKTR